MNSESTELAYSRASLAYSDTSSAASTTSKLSIKDLVKNSEYIYAYYPEYSNEWRKGMSGKVEAGRTGSTNEQGPDVIVIFGWMAAHLPHLLKYVDSYRILYPRANMLIVRSGMEIFWIGGRLREEIVNPLVALLEREEIRVRGEGRRCRMLVHVFSNGGCFQLCILHQLLQSSLSSTKTSISPLPQETLLVFDSCPGSGDFVRTVKAFTISIPVPSAILKFFVKVFVTMAMGVVFFLIRVGVLRDAVKEMRECLLRPVLVQSSFTFTESNTTPVYTPTPTPRLYLYSSFDALIPSSDVEAHIAEVRRRNVEVTAYNFGESCKSGHVAHARSEPERYWGLVKSCWERAAIKLDTGYDIDDFSK